MPTRPWPTIALLVAAPVALNVAFLGLGAVFDYPDVLQQPAPEVLDLFRANQLAVVTWFTVLAAAALALAPLAMLIGRLDRSATMRRAVHVGVAAAVVQAIGLLRWPLLVPTLADRAAAEGPDSSAVHTFELLGTILGTALGETLGYLLTAAWITVVCLALRQTFPLWFTTLGHACAALIALGALTPLALSYVDTANFIGYILWSAWLVTFAVLLGRAPKV
ncbi:DUF4386 family protein [Nocardia lijiangensis]|uniref:DUF4386 family protein n=1 Tax=Nocardia lijiangensis TaxID=299618 RepID=UPI0008307014|nr:DUF4386 family protein [Nocardia lijiangensis]